MGFGAGVMLTKTRNRNIPMALRFKLWSQPCVVCGVPYNIRCDHIVPFSKGGPNCEDNLQSLCSQCNYAKRNRLSNTDLERRVVKHGLDHFLRAVWMWDTRYINPFDCPGFERWCRDLCAPERLQHAQDLWLTFLNKIK